MAQNSGSLSSNSPNLYKATIEDIPAIKSMVNSAYSKYIERIGKPPAPMTEDWEQEMKTHEVMMLKDNDQTVGSIDFHVDDQTNSLKINNVVVDAGSQGRGYGYWMMEHVETEGRERGLSSVTLYTNVKMIENVQFYGKLGFVEMERKMEDGFERIYFRKSL
jgi:N-acetylglutamate synthase-like GNAT family acetyltransferase